MQGVVSVLDRVMWRHDSLPLVLLMQTNTSARTNLFPGRSRADPSTSDQVCEHKSFWYSRSADSQQIGFVDCAAQERRCGYVPHNYLLEGPSTPVDRQRLNAVYAHAFVDRQARRPRGRLCFVVRSAVIRVIGCKSEACLSDCEGDASLKAPARVARELDTRLLQSTIQRSTRVPIVH